MFVQTANCLVLAPYSQVFHKAGCSAPAFFVVVVVVVVVVVFLCLFCIFINDLPLHIHDRKVRNFLFADDSSLDTSGKTVKETEVTLQKSLNEVSNWFKSNLMCLHPVKKLNAWS